MAGIYFHIPFCKQACHYCDFHFSTNHSMLERMLSCMMAELRSRKFFLGNEPVESIYFGGGTPSLLRAGQIEALISISKEVFEVDPDSEITLEANPDDLTPDFIDSIHDTSINRFSVGLQSFHEEDLRWMNRAHNASDASGSIELLLKSGYKNLSIDLIYGYPLLTDRKWSDNLNRAIDLGVPHISAYSMTVEPRTALAHSIKQKRQPPMDEEQSARQFMELIRTTSKAGYQHYEISNLAKPGFTARHNSNYWKGVPYLGIGPSAHSYKNHERCWNVSNNMRYIDGIEKGKPMSEREVLTLTDQLNEYIMTSLRTMWGLDLNRVEECFGESFRAALEREASEAIRKDLILRRGAYLLLSEQGKLIADGLAADLFFEQSEH